VSDGIGVDIDGHVAVIEVRRGPHNFFDEESLRSLGGALIDVDAVDTVRAVVLASEGRSFCAGADLRGIDAHGLRRVYREASLLFATRKPIVAAVQGAAVGGGLGLAMACDFRVAGSDARLTANFARLGFHHGFGLSVTLPAVVGQQKALELLYTGRDVDAAEAVAIGLCDRVAEGSPRNLAVQFASEIAESAPLALVAIRSTMRRELASRVVAALDAEAAAQTALLNTADFREGVQASIGKRPPLFTGG
jgi:enoyl-CoA hydratase/carnithine racemase